MTDQVPKPESFEQPGSSSSQNRLIVLCWLVYTVSYLGRYSFSSNITNIMDFFGVSHAEAGLVTTFFFFAYGAGQFVNGLLCKKYNKQILFPAVLITASLANVAVFAGIPFGAVKYVWLVNGIVQSVLWSSIVNILTDMLDEKHLKTALVVLGATTAAGTFITYFAGFLFTHLDCFMFIFLFAAIVMTAVGFVWAFSYKRICAEIKLCGLDANVSSGDTGASQPGAAAAGRFTKAMVASIIIFAMFAVICNFLKDGLQTWVPGMLKEIYGLEDSVAILVSLILPLLSAACGAFTVFARKYIKNTILLTAVLFAVCGVFSVALKLLIGVSFFLSAAFFGIIAFLSHCINTCITVVTPFHFKNTGRSGLLSGILNGCCYAGSTVSAYALGSAADTFGWDAAIMIFIAVSAAAALLGLVSFPTFKK
ncbi:MAG: MFS transporter [Clostridia bacterium]|nr:MFS transporter [Clostridia bacterium]